MYSVAAQALNKGTSWWSNNDVNLYKQNNLLSESVWG